MTTVDTASSLLADKRLDPHGPRLAALWARIDLERAVDAALAAYGWTFNGANMRSKLLCLRVAAPDSFDPASVAWHGLSVACHQHAYEFGPTSNEVQHLIALVDRVRAAADAQQASSDSPR